MDEVIMGWVYEIVSQVEMSAACQDAGDYDYAQLHDDKTDELILTIKAKLKELVAK